MHKPRSTFNIPRAAILVCLAFATWPASAQMISPTTPPGTNSTAPSMSSPSLPSSCVSGTTGQPVPCPPAPETSPVPAPPSADYVSGGSGPPGSASDMKVLSYFQRGTMQLDTSKAFGFVLLPKSALTDREKLVQKQFCDILLASLDFMSPDVASSRQVLATYWPLVGEVTEQDIEDAFRQRNCTALIAWYDYSLARAIASKAGVSGMSGPLLITWPSQNVLVRNPRDPLVVDFANADYDNASRALAHWFKQVSRKPELWTSYIREGTIRAELADAINETAGVMMAVLAGKWESVSAVSDTP